MAAKQSIIKLKQPTQESLIKFNNSCIELFKSNWSFKSKLREIDLLYSREKDLTSEQAKAKLSNVYGNSDAIQNITVPVVMPQVEAAVTYQASVFLTGHPIFGVVAPPAYMDAALQLETIIEAQSTKGGWPLKLMQVMRDGFKYNLGAVELSWAKIKTPAVEANLQGTKPTETVWEGNVITKLDMYNTFWDSRVAPSDVPTKAEFAGYVERLSRTALKSFINSLDDVIIANVKAAFESGIQNNYHIPDILPSLGEENNTPGNFNWNTWASLSTSKAQSIAYKDVYEKTTLYARIIPSDFGLEVPAANTPQIWKFIIINDQVIIHAERQTNAHNLIPIIFCQPYEDGLSYQTKSLAANVAPMQSVSSSLMNSVLAARRKAIYDRTVYDPSKIAPKDMNSSNPIANIPVKASAYNSDLRSAFVPFPFNDNQSSLVLSEISVINSLADQITGQNKAQQGQFVKGNKTRAEYSDVMANANGRSQTVSIALESQFFTPLKELIKINILQYQGGTELYNKEARRVIKVDPVALRNAITEFKLTDGLLPSDKVMNLPAYQAALQVIGSSPEIAANYNLGDLVSYLLKTQGANVKDFEKSPEQKAYEQAMQQWQQMAMMAMEQQLAFNAPQPNPQDYGWDLQTQKATEMDQPSIIEQVMAIQQGEQQNAPTN